MSSTARDEWEQRHRGRSPPARRPRPTGNTDLPATPGQAPPKEKSSGSGQHKEQEEEKSANTDTATGTVTDTEGGKARRSRRGGVRNARRRANRERREREALLDTIPEQRGSLQGQRAVDRKSFLEQPWRRLDVEQGDNDGKANTAVRVGETHKRDSRGGQTRVSGTPGTQARGKTADASAAGSLPQNPITGKAVVVEVPKTIPTEPKSDRLARERREAAESKRPKTEDAFKIIFKGDQALSSSSTLPKLPDYKFGDDEWSLKESTKGVDADDGNFDARDPKDDGTIRSDRPCSSETDWASIKQRMESKLGKPPEATDEASALAQPSAEVEEDATIKEPQGPNLTGKYNPPGWSFDKVL